MIWVLVCGKKASGRLGGHNNQVLE